EEIGAVRGARHAPGESARDGADARDPADVAVAHLLLPLRQPGEHRVDHVMHPNDRVLPQAAAREGGMDEGAMGGEAEPDGPEVCEDELLLGRLAEEAHVRRAAVLDEITRTGPVAAVLLAPELSPLRLL